MSTTIARTAEDQAASSAIESAKRAAAQRAVKDHFDPTARYVGIGSGSTIVYVVEAIQALSDPRIQNISFVPTGYQSRQVILKAGLKDLKFDSLPENTLIDVAFDGADEIDDDLNCIKGGGACLYQEKLVATQAKKFICVADHRKLQPRLLTFWKYIPIEVEPLATHTVFARLEELGATSTVLREGHMMKAGPIKTDQDNFIIDACFKPLLLPIDVEKSLSLHPSQKGMDGRGEDGVWEVKELAREIKAIEGVLSVGLFVGENGLQSLKRGTRRGGQKPVAAYFGMDDGSVRVRHANEDGTADER
ncbi:ribose-5-phosphate isomerase rki1 [Puttea exsequens]|nr:ribose-5-phosphate isomerase rki1 [Puttea exsequens]